MTAFVRKRGVKEAADCVDVVTTGTFGPMCSSGVLINDPYFRTIGTGTKIFLCGGTGWITGPGTQHNSDPRRSTRRSNGRRRNYLRQRRPQGDEPQVPSGSMDKGIWCISQCWCGYSHTDI